MRIPTEPNQLASDCGGPEAVRDGADSQALATLAEPGPRRADDYVVVVLGSGDLEDPAGAGETTAMVPRPEFPSTPQSATPSDSNSPGPGERDVSLTMQDADEATGVDTPTMVEAPCSGVRNTVVDRGSDTMSDSVDSLPSQGANTQLSSKSGFSLPRRSAATAHITIQGNARAVTEIPAGRCIGNYVVIEEIARGGMGVVCKARQRDLDRVVALKLLIAGAFATEDAVQRFLREARAAARLQHPAICPVHDVGVDRGNYYYAMDYVKGRSLSRWARKAKPSLAELLGVFRKVCDGVHYAHVRGIIHRDLKPSNIMVDAERRPFILDFGLAKEINGADDGLTRTGHVLGTPCYMPPEQAGGRGDVDTRSDVYSLGAILYQILSGQKPFEGMGTVEFIRKVQTEDPIPLRKVAPQVPRDLETVVHKCLAKNKDRRYQSAFELHEDIQRVLNHEPIHARRTPLAVRARMWVRRHPTLATAVGVGLVTASLFAGWRWHGSLEDFATARAHAAEARRLSERAADALKAAVNPALPEPEVRRLLDERAAVELERAASLLAEARGLRPDDAELVEQSAELTLSRRELSALNARLVERRTARQLTRERAQQAKRFVGLGEELVAAVQPGELLNLAAITQAEASLKEAERLYIQAMDRDPRTPGVDTALATLVDACRRVDSRRERLAAAERVRTLEQESDVALRAAGAALDQGDPSAARDAAVRSIERLDRALEEDPEHATLRDKRYRAADTLADIAVRAGNLDLAIFVLEQAAPYAPERAAKALADVRATQLDQEALAAALDVGAKARIAAASDAKQVALGLTGFREALRLDPTNREALFGLAFCEALDREHARDFEGALTQYEGSREHLAQDDWRRAKDVESARERTIEHIVLGATVAARKALESGQELDAALALTHRALELRAADSELASFAADLAARASVPAGMILVPGEALTSGQAFYVGEAEVTNAQFSAFVQAGGYENESLWGPGAASLRSSFVDSTGRPGPSGWIGGKPAAGTDPMPVTGVSWHEARAYASFAGQRLPTEGEWQAAALFDPTKGRSVLEPWRRDAALEGPYRTYLASGASKAAGAPLAHVNGAPIHDRSPLGADDMYGNVREWTYTASGKAALRGGCFASRFLERALATTSSPAEPGTRSPAIGFRVAQDVSKEMGR